MAENNHFNPIKMPPLQASKPELTMAPLIDVVFLLLIFFMVTTVFPENRGLVIEKPQSEQTAALKLKKIIFMIDQHGAIFFKERKITTNDVTRLIETQIVAAPDSAVLLKVDRRATTEVLIAVMDACKKGGADRVGIATSAKSSE